VETETKQVPFNIGRNVDKKMARRQAAYRRQQQVKICKLHGVKAPKLKRYD
jgi:hypothetical protein